MSLYHVSLLSACFGDSFVGVIKIPSASVPQVKVSLILRSLDRILSSSLSHVSCNYGGGNSFTSIPTE